MVKKYSVGLSAKEFKRLSKRIKVYRQELLGKCQLFVEEMGRRGVEIAQMRISSEGAISTGELLSSLDLEVGDVVEDGAKCIIFTDCEWAPYVEFGTGIVGSESPHPDTSLANWKYDVNEHGEKGWFYNKDGAWHWTKGMPSRPFMYETGQSLRDVMSDVAKEVFK